jgi:hypothetical protein
MDTVTYPDPRVAPFLRAHFVPVKVPVKQNRDLAEQYQVSWTPNVVIADERGTVHERIEGFLPPAEFVARLSLGAGKYHLHRNEFDRAKERFEEVARRHHGTAAGAEALYWLGVAAYKQSHDPSALRTAGWEQLAREYPDSEWAKRAQIPKAG